MPLNTILRAMRVLGCEMMQDVPTVDMKTMRRQYPDMWAYADVIANLICCERDNLYAALNDEDHIQSEETIVEECVLTFNLMFQMAENDASSMTRCLIHTKPDRKSIINAVIGRMRQTEMVDPTKTYHLSVKFINTTGDSSAPNTGRLMFHGGTWYFEMCNQPNMKASGYECVNKSELDTSIWHLNGWRKDEDSAAMQTDVEFGDTIVTMLFQSKTADGRPITMPSQ